MKYKLELDGIILTIENKKILFDAREHQGMRPDVEGFIQGYSPVIYIDDYCVSYRTFTSFYEALGYCNNVILQAIPRNVKTRDNVRSLVKEV